MKKNLCLLTLLISSFFLLIGCSKDKDDKISIEGTWIGKKGIVTYYINGVKDESGENGGTTDYGEGDATLTLSGGKFSLVGDRTENESGTYTYVGKTLTLKSSEGGEEQSIVKELTQTSLILVDEFTEEMDGKTYRVVADIYFTR